MQEGPIGRNCEPRRGALLVAGRRYELDSPEIAGAIASAYAGRHRPRCLCRVDGVEMYVARLAGTNESFIVKRMPHTGSQHAPDCLSYEPPAEFSGLGQVLGTAISEDPATGETKLRLSFAMARIGGRSTMPATDIGGNSVASDGAKLSLRGLLHYLWDQAELTRWQPGFTGKRTWATVRRHLTLAAQNKLVLGDTLDTRLYIPEVFSVEQREAINARRMVQWARAVVVPGKPHQLMLLIAEVKEIVPARYGFKAILKHVPDQAFSLDERLYRRMGRRFEPELTLWSAADNLHMITIATFGVSASGLPMIAELSLMPVTHEWLPVEDSFERQLIDKLIRDGRSFVKGLRYNMRAGQWLASAILTDAGDSPVPLYIAPHQADAEQWPEGIMPPSDLSAWAWVTAQGVMPPLPRRGRAAAMPTPVKDAAKAAAPETR